MVFEEKMASYSPLVLQAIPQIKDFHLDFARPIMGKNLFVRLPLTMFDTLKVFRVRCDLVSGSKVGEVTLDVS